MTHADWIALLQASVPSVITGIVGWLLGSKLNDIHVSFNSKMDAAMEAKKALGHAGGLAQGLAQGRSESKST